MTESQRRRVPLISGDELATQLEFLDFQRAAVLIKCEGLSAAQLRARLVPTGTNLLGLVAHLTVAECYWFGHVLGGEPYPDPDFSMEVDAEQDCGEVLGAYRDSWSASNAVVHRIADPNALTALPVAEEHLPLRWLVGHMATETARHAGHADILRELLDGVTGR